MDLDRKVRCRRTLRCGEVKNVAIFPEHVNLLNAVDRLHVQLLERALQLFVVLRAAGLSLAHDFSAHRALATYFHQFPPPSNPKQHPQ